MLISIEWLRRYVDLGETTPGALAETLTMTGFPVVAAERFPAAPGRASEDIQLDVEITSNRPDLQSHLGVAREVAGMFRAHASRPEVPDLPISPSPQGFPPFDVAVDAPDLCPIYTARVIRGVQVGPSPDWLVRLLEAVGQRSINNVVDVTNFVLLESGQPLHAFDLAKLQGQRLVARRAAGEELTSIDESRMTVGADELVIADAGGPVALAGVMGGLDSEVSEATTDVVLECAVFDPLAIRRASRAHQLRTESSFRFERFVDAQSAVWASDRAAALFVEVCGATEVGPICGAGPAWGGSTGTSTGTAVTLRTARVERVLGIPVSESEIREVLSGLGLVESERAGDEDVTTWDIPSWRRHDLHEEIDLVEEVARRIGFDRIPATVRIPVRPLPSTPVQDAVRRLRDALAAAGLRECCTEPFVGAGAGDIALLRASPALKVENPMRHDENLLRRSLLGPLLRVVQRNEHRGVASVRLFEIAPVYLRKDDGDPETLPTEEMLLAAVVMSGGYHNVMAVLDVIADALGVREHLAVVAGAPAPLALDRRSALRLGGRLLGHAGEISTRCRRDFGLAGEIAVLEVRADLLAEKSSPLSQYVPISRFPAVERDLAFVLEESVAWTDLAKVVSQAAGPLLAGVAPFDRYHGPQVGDGKKSIALRMELRSHDKTLTGDAADAVVADVVAAVTAELGGVLRA